MSQEYTEDKEVKLTKLSSGRRLLEAMLILCSLFAIWLMAALLSFNPSDPSWSQTAWHEPIHNLGGAPGAWLADTLFFIFGVMAYTIPVIIIGGCWFAWRHQENDEYIDYFAVSLRLIGALALILTSCGLAAINADDIWYFASGGVIGSLLSTTLQPLLHSSGGTIALLCIWAAGLTLFTGCRGSALRKSWAAASCPFSPLPATVPVGMIPGSMKANTKTTRKSTTTKRRPGRRNRVAPVSYAARWRGVSVWPRSLPTLWGVKPTLRFSPANAWMTAKRWCNTAPAGRCCRRRCTVFRRQRRASRRG